MNCPACGSPLSAWHGVYRRCRRCRSLAAVEERRDGSTAVYEDPSYHEGGEARGAVYHASRLAAIASRVAPPARMLEIGCGTGTFSVAALGAGFDVGAIEPGARFEDAAARLGARVSRTTWEDSLAGDGTLDVVCAWEVIEHLPDPRAFVAAASRALRPGGCLALSTPSATSFTVRVLSDRDPMLCPDEHLQLFSRRGLAALFDQRNWATVDMRGFGYLFPDEAARGIEKAVRRPIPQLIAKGASLASQAIAHTPLALGVEVYAIR